MPTMIYNQFNVMARTFRRRSRRTLSGVRKRYGRRKLGLRKRSRFGRRRVGRGMQRIQRRRYPARNPFGDKVQVKFKFTNGGTFTVTNAAFVQQTGAFNDLSQAETAFTACPGFTVYPTLFRNYRVTGVKIRFTPMMHPATAAQGPATAFIMGGDGVLLNPSIATAPEQRWITYKTLNNWQTGGTTKSLGLYLSTMKVGGADRTIANDQDYTSTCNTTSPFYNAVPEQVAFQFGLLNTSGALWPGTGGALLCTYMVSFTYYVSFWGRREILV